MANHTTNSKNKCSYTLTLSRSDDKDIIKKLDSQESVEAYLKDLIRKDIVIQTKKPSEMSIEELRKVEEEYNVILKMFKDAAHN